MTGGISWLASYPKSGNTWVRALLSSVKHQDGLVDVNQLEAGPIASARDLFDTWAGVPSSDLDPAEVEALRPDHYRWRAGLTEGPQIIKVHDAWRVLPDGQPLFPADVSRGVIYIVRHPADVAVSFASHAGISIGKSVDRLCRHNCVLSGRQDRLTDQLPQQLLSWSGHVRSWLDDAHLPVLLVRYEDLLTDAGRELDRLLSFLGWTESRSHAARAIESCRFENLQAQERSHGFKERPVAATSAFFRAGRSGQGRTMLTVEQWDQLCGAHEQVMRRLGYEMDRGDV
jgi:aryl sulfotransferase